MISLLLITIVGISAVFYRFLAPLWRYVPDKNSDCDAFIASKEGERRESVFHHASTVVQAVHAPVLDTWIVNRLIWRKK